MYEQPPQQSMQQQSMQQQSYQQPAYQQQQQQGDLRQQQGDLRQQQQQSPQRSLSGPAVIDTTDLRAFLMRCAAPPPRCTPVVNLAGGAGAPSTTAPRSMSTRAPAPPCLPPPPRHYAPVTHPLRAPSARLSTALGRPFSTATFPVFTAAFVFLFFFSAVMSRPVRGPRRLCRLVLLLLPEIEGLSLPLGHDLF